ncbi:T9SS type A sorting domain-containing protein [bacterium]|nr:T9SS type A sorting domain-containing protein [bacterium]
MKKILIILCALLFPVLVSASDWQFQGVPVCIDASDAAGVSMIEDGDGGAIMVWIDGRYNGSVFVQKINASGEPQWTDDGVAVCTVGNIAYASYGEYNPRLVSDGSGGAIIVWCDYRNGTNWDIYAQRINATGNAEWTVDGVAICVNATQDVCVEMTKTDSNNVIIVWNHFGGISNNFAQKINFSGAVQWTTNGVQMTQSGGQWQDPVNYGRGVVTDGAGGAIIVYGQNDPVGTVNLYTQKINSSGAVQWNWFGVTLCALASTPTYHGDISSDGFGGAVFVWGDQRGTGEGIYAQRINNSGTVLWTENGIFVTSTSAQTNAEIVSDGSGGAVLLSDVSEQGYDLYAQRIDSVGTKLWNQTDSGILLCSKFNTADAYDTARNIVRSDGGVDIVFRDSSYNIFAQKSDLLGNVEWSSPNGVSVCVRDEYQWESKIVSDGLGGAIVAWVDERNGNKDIYAQSVKPLHMSSAEPFYSLPGKIFNASISGTGFVHLPEIKIIKPGGQEVTATNVVQAVYELITYTFDTTGLVPGVYSIQTSLNEYSASLSNSFFVLEQVIQPGEWHITDRGQLGNPSLAGFFYGIQVSDGDNDGYQEVFVANRDQKIFYLDNYTSGWNITSLPDSPMGENCSSLVVCDADHDNEKEVYVATLSNNIYQFKGTGWVRTTVGTTTEKVYSLAYGDVDLDGVLEIYAACADGNIYKFMKKTTWERTTVGTAPDQVFAVAVGDGDSDGLAEVYAACADNKIYQYEYNGTSWSTSEVGSGSGDMYAVATGDGNRDGQKEVYGANEDGKVYQFKWLVSSWAKSEVGQSTLEMYDVKICDADNSGENAVYAACGDGHVYQFKMQSTQWVSADLGDAGTPLYKLDVGDGDNDNQFEIYAIGEDNHVREYKVNTLVVGTATPTPTATPTATATPIPGFGGKVISKKYIYAAPNPVRGNIAKIVIFTNQPAEVSGILYTTSNQEVLSFRRYYGSSGKHEEHINVSNLANGVYLLLVKAKGADGTKERVIKKIALVK